MTKDYILKDDYTAHVLVSKTLMMQNRPAQALSYASQAQKLYPQEVMINYQQNRYSVYAYNRLKKWGYAK